MKGLHPSCQSSRIFLREHSGRDVRPSTFRVEGPTSESCFELGCFVLGWVGWVGLLGRVGLFRVRLGRWREW